jgi:hypothetical protein
MHLTVGPPAKESLEFYQVALMFSAAC